MLPHEKVKGRPQSRHISSLRAESSDGTTAEETRESVTWPPPSVLTLQVPPTLLPVVEKGGRQGERLACPCFKAKVFFMPRLGTIWARIVSIKVSLEKIGVIGGTHVCVSETYVGLVVTSLLGRGIVAFLVVFLHLVRISFGEKKFYKYCIESSGRKEGLLT